MTTTDLAPAHTVIDGVPMMDASEARAVVTRIKTRIDLARGELLELHDREGWRALGYSSWRKCVEVEFGSSTATLYRQLEAAEIARELGGSQFENLPTSHLQAVKQLPPEQGRAALDQAYTKTDGKPTAKDVRAEVDLIASPPNLADILLRLDAHGYAKTTTREKGGATLYSFRDYSGRHDETGGEVELAEGELSFWLAELDSAAAYAQAKQERFIDARDRAGRLGYDLTRDGGRFVLTPAGRKVPALVGTLDQQIKTIEGYEKNAAKAHAPLPSEDEQHRATIEAILKQPHTPALIQQAYDHAANIQSLDLHNKMIDRIDRATDEPPAPASDSAAHHAKEAADQDLLSTAQANIALGNIGDARRLLDQVQVSTWQRDQLLATIPAKDARAITLAFTRDECAALIKEAKAFERSGITKDYPTISQALVLLIAGIRGAA